MQPAGEPRDVAAAGAAAPQLVLYRGVAASVVSPGVPLPLATSVRVATDLKAVPHPL